MKPFLKWCGGKAKVFPQIRPHLPAYTGTYIEPFLGGGAAFFALLPQKAVLSDINTELVTTYQALQKDPAAVWEKFRDHVQANSPDYYRSVRKNYGKGTDLERAALFVYLNRAGFNGLFRVNKKGEYNVPPGRPGFILSPPAFFQEISAVLQPAQILNQDFRKTIELAQEDDFLFCDPPYVERFTSFTSDGFSAKDLSDMVDLCHAAKSRGVTVAITFHASTELDKLFDNFIKVDLRSSHCVSGHVAKRGFLAEKLYLATPCIDPKTSL